MMDATKKSKKKRIIFGIAIVLVVLIVIIQAVTIVLYNKTFHQRFSSNNNKGILSFEDFPQLTREKGTFASNKEQKIVGYFYSAKGDTDYKAVVILNHGFGGGGHKYYIPQINYLAQNGYLVYAFDKTGNDESEGKYVKGLAQGVIDLEYALDYVRKEKVSKNLPIMLYGHSWGAYSACTVLEKETDIKAVVSLSGFNKSQDMLVDQGEKMYGKFVGIMKPFLTLCDFINFGFDASDSSLNGLKKTNAKVLLYHSDDDETINVKNSFDLYKEKLGNKENLSFVRMNGKDHDVTNSNASMKYNEEKNAELTKIVEANNDELTDEIMDTFLQTYDFQLSNELDIDVMKQIVTFYDNSLK